MNTTLTIDMFGPKSNMDKLMKRLRKAKVEFSRIGTSTDDEGNDIYEVQFGIKSKLFWKIYPKIRNFGNLTIK